MPTDTIYGLVGTALSSDTVKGIYRLRKRNPSKPMIVLIGTANEVSRFGVVLDGPTKRILKKVWPGPVSVILPISPRRKAELRRLKYLHRGTGTLAFRLPGRLWLRRFLKKTGPLVAPSANLEGRPPARTIRDAKKYFGDRVGFYVDIGKLAAKPSTLIRIQDGTVIVLRKGGK